MKNRLLTLVGVSVFSLTSCELMTGPLHGMGRGAPEVNEQGRFSDSESNWQFFEKRARARIHDEKHNLFPDLDWERAWRVSFKSWETSQANPERMKRFVIKLRREAGLPVWGFMLN